MPAKSEKQRRLMGAALNCKRTGNCGSDKIKELADSMTEKELSDFAKKESFENRLNSLLTEFTN